MAKKHGPKMAYVPSAESAIQLKIALKHIRPPIWRRVVVPDNWTLGQLHTVIQSAMGWEDYHLHAFKFGAKQYMDPEMSDGALGMDMANESQALLRKVAGKEKTKFIYEYDFGDGWEHTITVEKLLPFDPAARYPVCLDGARACPPEDCGGVPGYMGMLEAMSASEKTKWQKEQLEWLGSGYDPERFDLDAVNRRLTGRRA